MSALNALQSSNAMLHRTLTQFVALRFHTLLPLPTVEPFIHWSSICLLFLLPLPNLLFWP
jgi:hypothetical protein